MPPRCPMTCRVVIGADFFGKDGQYFWIGLSSSSFPCSQSSIAPTAVNDFEIDASRNSVCSLAGTLFSRSANPNPAAHSYLPSSTTATERPGTRVVAMNLETAASIWLRFSGESVWSWPCDTSAHRNVAPTRNFRYTPRADRWLSQSMGRALWASFFTTEGTGNTEEIGQLLGDSRLVTHRQPVSSASDPDSGVPIGAAEVFSELRALYVGTSGYDSGIAVNADNHIGDVNRIVFQLAALAG